MALNKLKNPFNSFAEIVKKINEVIDNIGGGGGGFTPTPEQQQAIDSGITSEILSGIETDIDNLKENLANFIGNFNSYANLVAYSGTLTNNDYAVVAQDETHSNECWRYVYNAGSGVWVAQYKINETPINTIDQSSNPTDTDSLSDLSGTTNKRWTFAKIWNWISSKLTSLLDAKADKATTLSGYGITDAYTKTETDTKLNAKLNLSGGTMTGAITTKNGTGFKRDVDNDALSLYGGTAYNKGAYIQLAGKDRSSTAGGFTLAATNGTTTKLFQGKPDGTLNWDGKKIVVNEGTYTGDNVMTISNIASQGLSNGQDYASNVTRRIVKVGNMVFFTCHIKWTAVAVGKAWTTIGTIASAFRPNFNRPTIVGMVYNNGENEACGGNVDTTGVIQVWTNDKVAGNNYQIRLSGFWTVD